MPETRLLVAVNSVNGAFLRQPLKAVQCIGLNGLYAYRPPQFGHLLVHGCPRLPTELKMPIGGRRMS